MKRELKSKYARIDEINGKIELFENAPKSNGLELIIEDCSLEFDGNNNCRIQGKRWIWGIVFKKTFLSKLNYGVIDKHTKIGYETLLDRWNKLQSAYVDGWHRKSETKFYSAVVSKFFVVL